MIHIESIHYDPRQNMQCLFTIQHPNENEKFVGYNYKDPKLDLDNLHFVHLTDNQPEHLFEFMLPSNTQYVNYTMNGLKDIKYMMPIDFHDHDLFVQTLNEYNLEILIDHQLTLKIQNNGVIRIEGPRKKQAQCLNHIITIMGMLIKTQNKIHQSFNIKNTFKPRN